MTKRRAARQAPAGKGQRNMYDDQEFRPADHMSELYQQEVAAGRTRKPGGPRRRTARKAVALVLSAVLFGGIAGGSFYGVNALLSGTDEAQQEAQTAAQDNGVAVALLSYTDDTTGNAESQSLDVRDIAAEGLPSVVSVTNISVQEVQSYFGQFGRNGRGQVQLRETTSCGSGVIIAADDAALYMVTNYHVVEGATTLSVTFVDDQTYEAQLCGYDANMDIALLRVSTADLSSETLSAISVVAVGDSDALVVGEQVVAIGNALGYGQSVTTGIVSALDRAVGTESDATTYIQTDAAINPGNSGGALLNMDGELVGINTAKVSSTDVEGMGYAIPISQVLERIGSLMG